MLFRGSKKIILCCMLLLCFQCSCKIFDITKDQTTSRANTLFDDADDIQRQLDNEVRDRFGQFKTVWVFHVPTRINFQKMTKAITLPNDVVIRLKRKPTKKLFKVRKTTTEPEESCHCGDIEFPEETSKCVLKQMSTYFTRWTEAVSEGTGIQEIAGCGQLRSRRYGDPWERILSSSATAALIADPDTKPDWHFWNQNKWHERYKDCGGRAQSPVTLPVDGLIHARGARKLIFSNYDVQANNLTVVNDGRRVIMYGNWPKHKWPLVYGGAAHSRRYLFHSLSVYWPSEHPIGGLYYPMETQLLHISAEYNSFDEAVKASRKDPMAFLGVVNIYKYSSCSHPGIMMTLRTAQQCQGGKTNLKPVSLGNFSAPFSDHVCYYGSLTTPPCTESVLWIIRRRSLPISRDVANTLHHILGPAPTPFTPTGDAFMKTNVRAPQPLNDRKIFAFD